MRLAAGSRLGPYEILAPLGAGGMGEVYRARDSKLHRSVAIKVLPEIFAADPERLLRFEREAMALAALSHPNIAGIFGAEESGGIHALVLELVEGQTLADRITHGPLPLSEASAIAVQIADALETAHDQGIVHRDLKPSNVKIREDGTVKVLDFGLAKILERSDATAGQDLTASPTVISPANMTGVGVILGTAAYMSPEQAKGRLTDKRCDVWAFGCVLYEMLSGRRAFEGDDLTETIAAVLRGEPDWKALPPDLPMAVRRLLERCLEKDRAARVHDISTAKFVLTNQAGRSDPAAPLTAPVVPSGRPWLRRWTLPAAMALTAAGVALGFLAHRPATSDSGLYRVARFQLPTASESPFTTSPSGSNVAISPDGSRIVYTALRNGIPVLFLRSLDRLQSLRRVPVEGGQSATIWRGDPTFSGASWGADDSIVFGYDFSVYRVPATGGQAQKIAGPDAAAGETGYDRPVLLPGGQAVLYTVYSQNGESAIVARRLSSGAVVKVLDNGFGVVFAPSGYLVYGQDDRLMAARFDVSTLAATSSPVPVEEGILTKLRTSNMAIASDGTTVYVTGQNAASRSHLLWVGRDGQRIGTVVQEALESARNVRLSPDGHRLVVVVGRGGAGNLWVYDLDTPKPPLQLTFRDHNTFPVWSPDGRRIAFMSVSGGAFRLATIPSDGSVTESTTLMTNAPSAPLDWSPDSSATLMHRFAGVWLFAMKSGKAEAWLETPFPEYGARVSPDGRWVAYASSQAGSPDVWVRPFPGPGAPVRVSSAGGHDPVWSRDGKELFFTNGANFMSAQVLETATTFRAEEARRLFQGGFKYDDEDFVLRFYDVAPDGRFVMIEPPDTTSGTIVVAQHWDQVLKSVPISR
jgi:eukaryotic-like serine/threonine-protein kinase